MDDLKNEKAELETAIREAQNQYSILETQFETQTDEYSLLQEAHQKALVDLSKAVIIPDISNLLSQAEQNGIRKQVFPPNERHPVTDKMYGSMYEVSISDNDYYTYDKNTWVDILKQVQPVMKQVVGFGGTEASDCDNYANTLAVFTTLAFNKAKAKFQGAIGVAVGYFDTDIGTTHAFNVILLNDYTMWTYEPYSGDWLGVTDTVNTQSQKYNVRKINFSN
ncbi:hypothetical protein E2P71_06285 [Candidatus Bathyarchaeota archaeon]|nr:hypothetical protein E2P71_06285 [Candidatus Bathyarchaeota archaeon]